MASIGYFNQMQNTSGVVYNNIVQVINVGTTSIGGGNGTYSLGSSSGYTTAPTSTSGITLVSLDFLPKFSTSKIVINTSPIAVAENSNVADDYRLFAHASTTLLGWVTSGIANQNFSGGLGSTLGGAHLHCSANSWGTTVRTIRIGLDTSGNSSSSYFLNYAYGGSYANSPFVVTVMEMQA